MPPLLPIGPVQRKSHSGLDIPTSASVTPTHASLELNMTTSLVYYAVKSMKQPCEYNSNKVLPTIRSVLTDVLMDKGALNQTEVSEILGISQAAVSHYASEKRGDVSILDPYPEIEKSIRKLGVEMVNGLSPRERQTRICAVCRRLHKEMMEEELDESV